VAPDGVCHSLGGNESERYIAAKATPKVLSDPCVPKTASQPTGGIEIVKPRVLCCR
jgi:hypothetical protein